MSTPLEQFLAIAVGPLAILSVVCIRHYCIHKWGKDDFGLVEIFTWFLSFCALFVYLTAIGEVFFETPRSGSEPNEKILFAGILFAGPWSLVFFFKIFQHRLPSFSAFLVYSIAFSFLLWITNIVATYSNALFAAAACTLILHIVMGPIPQSGEKSTGLDNSPDPELKAIFDNIEKLLPNTGGITPTNVVASKGCDRLGRVVSFTGEFVGGGIFWSLELTKPSYGKTISKLSWRMNQSANSDYTGTKALSEDYDLPHFRPQLDKIYRLLLQHRQKLDELKHTEFKARMNPEERKIFEEIESLDKEKKEYVYGNKTAPEIVAELDKRIAELDWRKDKLKKRLDELRAKIRSQESVIRNQELIRKQLELEEARRKSLDAFKSRIQFERGFYIIANDDYDRGNSSEREYRRLHKQTLLRLFDNRCAKCFSDENGIDIDHFFISKNGGGNFTLRHVDGFLVNNAVPLCESCNSSFLEFFNSEELDRISEINRMMTDRLNKKKDSA